jgi:hypothetical protein
VYHLIYMQTIDPDIGIELLWKSFTNYADLLEYGANTGKFMHGYHSYLIVTPEGITNKKPDNIYMLIKELRAQAKPVTEETNPEVEKTGGVKA